MIYGLLPALLGTMQKTIEPAKKEEWQTTRKRALEMIEVEILRPVNDPTPLSLTNIIRLVSSTKRDPAKVLEVLSPLTDPSFNLNITPPVTPLDVGGAGTSGDEVPISPVEGDVSEEKASSELQRENETLS